MAAEPQPRGIARYGLDTNPYNPRPLALLEECDDHCLLLEDLVDDLKDAREYVERAAAVPEPAFVLVTGGGGTGRTTVCNYLLASYRDKRGIAAAKFITPDSEYKGRDPQALLQQWMNDLYWALRPGYAVKEAGSDLDDVLQNATGLDNPITYQANARNVLSNAARILFTAYGVAFGVRVERVEGEDIVNTMLKVFETTQTLVVLTPHAQESNRVEVEKAFKSRAPKGTAATEPHYPVVSLGTVGGEKAKRLIEKRWKAATESDDHPFAEAGVLKAFEAKARPPARVLELTAGVLETKAKSLPSGDVWPDARPELEIVEEVFVDLLKLIEKQPWAKYG
jgi:hypothetical protein